MRRSSLARNVLERRHVVIEPLIANFDRVAEAQLHELCRKVGGRRHARSSHQDRNHRDLTPQRGADLLANEIVG